MSMEFNMKYNKIETINHIVSQNYPCCLKDFNQVILDEDNSLITLPTLFSDVTVIDLDCIEIIKAKNEGRNRASTMDCCFAISDASNLEMLLVELRFNYQNLSNLNRNKLVDKVNGSIAILGNTVKISNSYVFIFQSNLVQQAKSRLQRMIPQIPNNYVVMDINHLITNYF